jgi:hypothetical protein
MGRDNVVQVSGSGQGGTIEQRGVEMPQKFEIINGELKVLHDTRF